MQSTGDFPGVAPCESRQAGALQTSEVGGTSEVWTGTPA